MTCYRHRFHTQFDAAFWGPPYQCPRCGWWHISFINRHILWDKVVFWGVLGLCSVYLVWIVVNAFIAWNWPA